jgi:hypothetical protein
MTPRRVVSVEVAVGWLVLAALVWLAIIGGAVWWLRANSHSDDLEARLRVACAQYAGLDLSGLATLCRDVGYQEVVYVQPPGAPPWWPTVHRVIQPEDLDR